MRAAVRKAMVLPPEHAATLSRGRDLLPQQRWSYSRRNVLEQCPRRYYYEYYAATVARRQRDPRIERLRRLKSLQNRYERTGAIAHVVIATYFRKAQVGDVWTLQRVVDWARAIFRADMDYSTADPAGLSPREGRFPPVLLHEYFYRQRDALEMCTAAEERLVAAIRVFFESINLAKFRLAGGQLGALVERNLTVSGLPCKTGGKLDLAFVTGGYVTVIDWKLGEPTGDGNESLQLAAYALWASQHFSAMPDAIRIYKAYLSANEIVPFPVNERVLANARARILQDAERMAAVHHYGQHGIVEAFTPCLQPKVCTLCPFREICPEGSALLHA